MKIKYIKLQNFAGIYAGTGLTDLTVDFSKNQNKIIMLIGGNGSGKTTLLSCLQPFRETNDRRKSIILEGKDGYKEICYSNDNDTYVIKHYYSAKQTNKNKSFIEKNGEELNESGSIRLFETIINKEFFLDKEYFKIGRIGSNVTNFIDLKTSERKKYINQFVPNIDEYLNAYDIINEKVKNFNRDSAQLKKELENLDKDSLVLSLSKINDDITFLKENIDKKKEKITSTETMIKMVNKELDGIDIDQLKVEIVDLQTKVKKAINTIKENEKLKNSSEEDLSKEKIKLESNNEFLLENKEKEKDNLISISSEYNEIMGKIHQLDNKINNFDLVDCKQVEEDLKYSQIKLDSNDEKLNSILEKIKFKDFDNKTYLNLKNEMNILENEIVDKLSSFDMSDLEESYNGYKVDYEFLASYDTLIDDANEKRVNLQDKISYIKNSNLKEIYDKKPKQCKITECTFIKNAVDFVENYLPKLYEYEKELDKLDNYIKDAQEKYENEKKFENIENSLKSIKRNYENTEYFKNYYQLTLNNITYGTEYFNNIKTDLERYYKVIEIKNDIEILNNEIEKNKNLLSVSKKEKEIFDSLNEQKEEQKQKLLSYSESKNKINEKINDIYIKINENKNTIDCLENYIKVLVSFKRNKTAYKEKLDILKDNEENIEKYEELTELLSTLSLTKDQTELASLEKEKECIITNISLFDKFKERLDSIENKLNDYIIIKDALDPKKGIPLIFMNNFLKNIESKTNDLLETVYNGEFRIKFKINSKEFLVKVIKSDGTDLNDITEASQGEISLTVISLSLSMIENLISNSKHKIIYLDEVDSTLSIENRRMYLDLIQKQIDTGIEQCFVISHNEEFYSQNVDLILMKDNNVDTKDKEFMNGKNILFSLNK